jgi:predicted membrane metal-binding protein
MRKSKRFYVALLAILALNAFFWLATTGFSLPRNLAAYFLGPRMIRAEVVLRDANGVFHDYRFDQGTIRGVNRRDLQLKVLERDGQLVTLQIAPNAQVKLNGRTSTLGALRRGYRVSVARDKDAPAHSVLAYSK